MTDPNDMAFWWPVLERTGVPVPRTELLATGVELVALLDGTMPAGYDGFLDALAAAAGRVGFPCFLRTGHTSHKHGWKRTCFLETPGDLPAHVVALVEFSELVDFLGLPTRTWAVREFLSLEHSFTAFDGMPVAREFRCFFRGGDAGPLCVHPYWPEGAIANPSRPDWRECLARANGLDARAHADLLRVVAGVAPHFRGSWSLDVARSTQGLWYAIDMAEMDRSFHWPGCPGALP